MLDAFEQAGTDVLDTLGASATYHSLLRGPVTLTAIIEKAVEVLDEGGGAYMRKPLITIKSGSVTPKSGDWVEIAAERYSVEQMDSDDGYLVRLWARRKL